MAALQSGDFVENLDFSSKLDDVYYDVDDGTRKKKAYIFNHFKYDKNPNQPHVNPPEERHGTDKDNERIFSCLEARRFEIECYRDASATKTLNVMFTASELKKCDVSCIVVIIMSHGDTDIIYAKDEPYFVSELFKYFTRSTCDLDGVPIIFFIQACRGSQLDKGQLVATTMLDSVDGHIPHRPDVLPLLDMLCMFSTAQDYLSWRNRQNGSWFIQSLCNRLESTLNKKEYLHNILTRVHDDVATNYASNTIDPNNEISLLTHNKKQMTHLESTLTKWVIF